MISLTIFGHVNSRIIWLNLSFIDILFNHLKRTIFNVENNLVFSCSSSLVISCSFQFVFICTDLNRTSYVLDFTWTRGLSTFVQNVFFWNLVRDSVLFVYKTISLFGSFFTVIMTSFSFTLLCYLLTVSIISFVNSLLTLFFSWLLISCTITFVVSKTNWLVDWGFLTEGFTGRCHVTSMYDWGFLLDWGAGTNLVRACSTRSSRVTRSRAWSCFSGGLFVTCTSRVSDAFP